MYVPRNSWLETNIRFVINLLLSVTDSGCQKDNAVNDRVLSKSSKDDITGLNMFLEFVLYMIRISS